MEDFITPDFTTSNRILDTKPKKKKAPSYFDVAKNFIKAKGDLYFYLDEFWIHTGKFYKVATRNSINSKVRKYLIKNNIPHGDSFHRNVVNVLRDVCYIEEAKLPKNPLMYFQNCILDLKTGETLEYSTTIFNTYVLPYDYDPDAICKRWIKFLNEVYENDQERIDLLQEWFGYCLSSDTRFEKFLIQVGYGGSGKGTIDKVQQALIGLENCAASTMGNLEGGFRLTNLIGKQLTTISETDDFAESRGKRKIMATLKAITGNDLVSIDRKNKDMIDVFLPTKVKLLSNETPCFPDNSGAIHRRLMILNHNACFSGKPDINLKDKLMEELSGIAIWAIEGYRRLNQNMEFTVPALSKQSCDEIRLESSPVLKFLKENCLVHESLAEGDTFEMTTDHVEIEKSHLRDIFVEWSVVEGHHWRGSGWFGKALKSALPKLTNARPRVGGKRVQMYVGIKLI